jgi:hypothetical protein
MSQCRCGQTFAAGVKHYCQLVDDVNLRLSQELRRSNQAIQLGRALPGNISPRKTKAKEHDGFLAIEMLDNSEISSKFDDEPLHDDEVCLILCPYQ